MGAQASKSFPLFPAVSHLKSFCMILASLCPLATMATAELLAVVEVVITELSFDKCSEEGRISELWKYLKVHVFEVGFSILVALIWPFFFFFAVGINY